MLDPITLGLIFAGIQAIAALVTLIILTINEITAWFNAQYTLHNPDAIAFTVKEALNTGQYTTVQGVLNRATGRVTAGRRIHSRYIDTELARIHRTNAVAIYS